MKASLFLTEGELAALGWMPLSEAPRDGEIILAFAPRQPRWSVAVGFIKIRFGEEILQTQKGYHHLERFSRWQRLTIPEELVKPRYPRAGGQKL
jgi:hypothetical protein